MCAFITVNVSVLCVRVNLFLCIFVCAFVFVHVCTCAFVSVDLHVCMCVKGDILGRIVYPGTMRIYNVNLGLFIVLMKPTEIYDGSLSIDFFLH